MTEAERLLIAENARLTVALGIADQLIEDLLRREKERHAEAVQGPSPDAGPVVAPEPRRWLKRRGV